MEQIVKRVTADVTYTSDASVAEVTDLTTDLEQNSVYALDIQMLATGTANGDLKVDFDVPTSASIEWLRELQTAGDAVNGGSAVTFVLASNNKTLIKAFGVVNTGVNGGKFKMSAAQGTSHADTTTLHKNSFIILTKIQ